MAGTKDIIAFAAIIFWPIIPLFWIPIHLLTGLFRKLGLVTLVFPISIWLPMAYYLYSIKGLLFSWRFPMPPFLGYLGWILFFIGLILHLLTGVYLRFGLIGLPEVSEKTKMHLVKKGPFALARHPTYLAHTMIFVGAFLVSGVLTVALVAVLDLLAVHLVIIPLEERELQKRFGGEYLEYMKRVPKFFPRPGRAKKE